jgi:diguanylate cyclase (GGDEF)-like protein
MLNSYKLLASILDSINDHITVIDQTGDILYINHSWEIFGEKNTCLIKNWEHVNYLDACNQSAAKGDTDAKQAAEGIKKVISAELDSFYFEYPCHSPQEKRWFMMRVIPLHLDKVKNYLITHTTITERKLAEEKVFNLSRIDSLTNIPNRRHFDEVLKREWLRCKRLKLPLSLAILDLDYFKHLNDHCGHQTGDICLQKVAKTIANNIQRSGDLCARFGGEEFAIILSGTEATPAFKVINKVFNAINALKIPNVNSPKEPTITTSIGLATVYPHQKRTNENQLIKQADTLLYAAKNHGRNQIVQL